MTSNLWHSDCSIVCLNLWPSSSFSLQTVKRPRKIQIPVTSRPSRAASHSNLLDPDPPRRTRRYSDDSDNRDRYNSRARSSTPDRNGHGNTLPLMSSGYKRLPHQDVAEKPIKTTLLKKKITDGKTSGNTEWNLRSLFALKCSWGEYWLDYCCLFSFCRVRIEAGKSDLHQAHDRYRPGCKGRNAAGGRPHSQGEN